MGHYLSSLMVGVEIVARRGPTEAYVTGLSYDAFTVRPGELFLAVEGVNSDRHQYIKDVERRGITAIVHSKPLATYHSSVAYIQVANVQRSMSPISAAYFGDPSARMQIIGVTGTNGKSTTASFIYQLINLLGGKAGLISSVCHDFGAGTSRNLRHASTPEAPAIQQHLYSAAENGLGYMIVEATSHGLSARNNRVGDVRFDVAVVTNVTHEHLEFHGTMDQYVHDKANLFRLMDRLGGKNAFGVVNSDDTFADNFISATARPVLSYGIDHQADLRAVRVQSGTDSSDFALEWQGAVLRGHLPLPGVFNVSNALAALLVVNRALGIPMQRILEAMGKLHAITGRMTPVESNQPFSVIVDYAHTPDSFEKLLPEVKQNTRGKLIVLFGSAGERDTKKRSLQGKIASLYADIVILTDEDPRGEDPMAILNDIAAACAGLTEGSNLYLIPDRRRAIAQAIAVADEYDTVLLLGKGHETSIAYAKGDIPWDEERIAKECIKEAGY